MAGTLLLDDGARAYALPAGSFHLLKRNHLIKFNKQPAETGEFKSLSVSFDQATLRAFSLTYGYPPTPPLAGNAVLPLAPNALYRSYLASLQPYE
ncbi:hypothetical protein GCM10027422_10120 [Hymenobacter arcticus]